MFLGIRLKRGTISNDLTLASFDLAITPTLTSINVRLYTTLSLMVKENLPSQNTSPSSRSQFMYMKEKLDFDV